MFGKPGRGDMPGYVLEILTGVIANNQDTSVISHPDKGAATKAGILVPEQRFECPNRVRKRIPVYGILQRQVIDNGMHTVTQMTLKS